MQRYFVKNIENERVIFESSDIHHIKNVMRMNIDEIIECVYNGELYKAKIESLDPLNVKIIEKKESLKTNKPYTIMIINLLDHIYIAQKIKSLLPLIVNLQLKKNANTLHLTLVWV